MVIEQWGFFSVPHCDTGHPFIMVISEHPWHLHLLLSVWPWSCPDLFLRLRSVAAGIQTTNLPLCEANALVHRALVSALNTTTEHICMFISKGTECIPWWVFVLYLIHCICILLEYTPSYFIYIIGTYRGRSILKARCNSSSVKSRFVRTFLETDKNPFLAKICTCFVSMLPEFYVALSCRKYSYSVLMIKHVCLVSPNKFNLL